MHQKPTIISDSKLLAHLKVEHVTTSEFISFDFSSISNRLKNLRKCEIIISSTICQQYDWAKIIDENFESQTEVVVSQKVNSQSDQTEAVFIKSSYQKTKIVIDIGPWILQS